MDEQRVVKCPTCGKVLEGITLDYAWQWPCSKCAKNQMDVLHCERGSKVRAVDLNAGYQSDSKQANDLLVEGRVYEVEKVNVGGWISYIWLKEFPGKAFNSVHFERCK